MTNEQLQTGLLDLSVELSSPELFSGENFTVYLLVKNPFNKPIWIKDVTVNVPSQMYWKGEDNTPPVKDDNNVTSDEINQEKQPGFDLELWNLIISSRTRLQSLKDELEIMEQDLDDEDKDTPAIKAKREQIKSEEFNHATIESKFYTNLGYSFLYAGQNASITYQQQTNKPIYASAGRNANINVRSPTRANEREISIRGSLPPSEALQPGCTGVWPVILGTKRNLFFLPSNYRLQFNVLYSFQNPTIVEEGSERIIRSETTSKTLTIRASIWAAMAGAIIGAVLGSLARGVQKANSWQLLVDHLGETSIALLLSCILSVAAIIFTARKTDTQSFVSVEDFWGGALIGFLIGFSGTSAFADFASKTSD